MKKAISLVLAFMMLMGVLTVSALAVEEPTILVSTEKGHSGDTVTVTVGLENNPGIACFEFAVIYDETVLRWTGFTKGALEGTWDAAAGETILWVNAENYVQDGEIFTLTFEILEDAPVGLSEVTVSYMAGEIFDEDERDVDFAIQAGSVKVKPEGADLNKDGVTDSEDLNCLMNYLIGDESLEDWEADINADGVVDVLDIVRFVRYLADETVELY